MNVRMDISSIDLSVFSGLFVPLGAIPTFEFTLYDNPSGANGLGNGTILDVMQASGTASACDVFNWTEVLLPLDTTGNTNGNVTLRINLLDGGYAAMDNFHITADVLPIPEPEIYAMFLAGVGLMGFMARVARLLKQSLTLKHRAVSIPLWLFRLRALMIFSRRMATIRSDIVCQIES